MVKFINDPGVSVKAWAKERDNGARPSYFSLTSIGSA